MKRLKFLLFLIASVAFAQTPAAYFPNGMFGGTNTYTSSHTINGSGTLNTTDTTKLINMNCSSACTLTLESAPLKTDWWGVISTGSTLATILLNSLNFNGSATAPTLSNAIVWWISSDGSNYFGGNISVPASAAILGNNVSGSNSSVVRPAGNSGTIVISGHMPTGSNTASVIYGGGSYTGMTITASNLTVSAGYNGWLKCGAGTGCSISSNNNSFTCSGCGTGYLVDLDASSGQSFSGNNNTYSGFGSGNRFRYNTTAVTWTTWETDVSPNESSSTYTP